MEATILTKYVLPAALALIMLGMGLSLVVADFKRVLKQPKAMAIGLFGQMVLLPAVGFGLAYAFNLPAELAVGLVILALCPGGTTSNMYSYLAKGDVALSISLTAVVSLIAPFTIPIFAGIAMVAFMGEGQALALPLKQTIIALLAITALPVGIGMAIKAKWSGFADKADKPVKVLSILFLALIIAGIIKQNASSLGGFFAQAGAAALALNVLTMALGFGIAYLFRLNRKQSITVGLEVGIQNGTTALLVTGTLLANTTMMIPAAVYSLIMFGTGALFAVIINRIPEKGHKLPDDITDISTRFEKVGAKGKGRKAA